MIVPTGKGANLFARQRAAVRFDALDRAGLLPDPAAIFQRLVQLESCWSGALSREQARDLEELRRRYCDVIAERRAALQALILDEMAASR